MNARMKEGLMNSQMGKRNKKESIALIIRGCKSIAI